MHKLLLFLFLLSFQFQVICQTAENNIPVTGKEIAQFNFSDVHYYKKKTLNSGDLKGKWTILDFWSMGCVACVKSFPKLNKLQEEFKNKIQFVLVGINDTNNKNIKQVYERFREKLGLNLVIAYDSALARQFGVTGVPYIVVIDPESKVYAITKSDFLQSGNLQNMMNEDVHPGASDKSQQGKLWEYWNTDTLSNDRVLYRSILSKYAGELNNGSNGVRDIDAAKGTYQTVHLNLADLYFTAYDWLSFPTDSSWQHPILEVVDSSKFHSDTYTYEGYYNYSVSVPKALQSKVKIQEEMQADLKRYFGYRVSIEKRVMPYWRLTASNTAAEKLASTASTHYFNAEPIGIVGKKIRVANILSVISQYNNQQPLQFIDETGIKGTIDISFNAVMTDLEDIKTALKKEGLMLQKAQKEMNVLVIKDY